LDWSWPCIRPAAHLAALAALCAGPAAAAAGDEAWAWGGALGVASHYVWRGLSYSQGAPAAQLDLHGRTADGWFAGAWASTLQRRGAGYDYGSHELNLYAGRAWSPAERWRLVVRYVRYAYPRAAAGSAYDHDELALAAVFDDRLSLSLAAAPASPAYVAGPADAAYPAGVTLRRRLTVAAELSLQQPLAGPLAAVAGIGYYDTSRLYGSAYAAWHAGLQARWGALELQFSRIGSDARAGRLFGSERVDGRWVLSALHRF
jgi:uncharacterized protein (TIGR02001 family)